MTLKAAGMNLLLNSFDNLSTSLISTPLQFQLLVVAIISTYAFFMIPKANKL